MNRFIVETDTSANAEFFLSLMKKLKFVKSVTSEKPSEELSDEDWIKPGRPATDEELENLARESEKSKGIPAKIARKQTMKALDKWIAQQKR